METAQSDRQQDRAVALLKARGMLRLSEFIAAGITGATVSRMEKRGQLRQLGLVKALHVRRGFDGLQDCHQRSNVPPLP